MGKNLAPNIKMPEDGKYQKLVGDFRPTRDMMVYLNRVNVRKGPLGSIRLLSLWGLEVMILREFPGLSDREARATVKYWRDNYDDVHNLR